jgi:hypothetical protein
MHQITMAVLVLLWLIMENEHPPGITGFTDTQHHEMDPKKQ